MSTCATCTYWHHDRFRLNHKADAPKSAQCGRLTTVVYTPEPVSMYTPETFGCNEWKPKGSA